MQINYKWKNKTIYIKILRLQILAALLAIQKPREIKNISKTLHVVIYLTLTNPQGCACVAEGREISNAANGLYVWVSLGVSHLLRLH